MLQPPIHKIKVSASSNVKRHHYLMKLVICVCFQLTASQSYNPSATSVPGELDTNISSMTLNQAVAQSQPINCPGHSTHRKDNR